MGKVNEMLIDDFGIFERFVKFERWMEGIKMFCGERKLEGKWRERVREKSLVFCGGYI